ncbi:MAG: SagB/ThcOx family dehydrogenase [Anaerolineae bacterium]
MIGRVQTALVVACLSLLVCLAGCNPAADGAPPEVARAMPLPSPIVSGGGSLAEALAERRSVRSFSDQTLTPSEIGQLLWAAQGVTSPQGYRTAPSAGALYPLEIYAVTAEGVYHYQPQGHLLAVHSGGDRRQALYEAALRQDPVREAPAIFVITTIYARTAEKYGAERSPRYVHMEAGHAAQNLLLQTVALGLGGVPIGAFHDERIQEALGLPEDEEPLYLIPVGHPLEANP